jgi:predicted Zn-dependent protease
LLNPRTIAYTGLTRDGTFLIENGKVTRPVTNFRWNQSIAALLANVDMVGREAHVAAEEGGFAGTPIVAPALKVRNFTLASVSDAV